MIVEFQLTCLGLCEAAVVTGFCPDDLKELTWSKKARADRTAVGLVDSLRFVMLNEQSLRGPRGGMIFFRKGEVLGVNLEIAINNAVFPSIQVCNINWTSPVGCVSGTGINSLDR